MSPEMEFRCQFDPTDVLSVETFFCTDGQLVIEAYSEVTDQRLPVLLSKQQVRDLIDVLFRALAR